VDIAVTGSSGLIGSAFVEAARLRGDRIVRVVRHSPGAGEIGWDINAGTVDVDGLEGIDAVVHLAGEALANKRWTDAQKRVIEDSRIKATSILSRAIAGLDRPPSTFLNGSAVGIYGDRGIEELTEDSTTGGSYLADLCVEWEAATSPAVDAGVRVAHLRTGIVLSTAGGALAEQLPFFRFGLGGRIGSGRQYWSWISMTDQIDAMFHVLDGEQEGPVNLTSPYPVTNAAFVAAVGASLHRPSFIPTPTAALDLKLGKEAVREMLFASQRVLPAALEDSAYTFSHSTIDVALAHIL